jgi:hypothetical protein
MTYYLQKPFGKFLSAVMCGLQLVKISLFFFGNLYYIAQFQYEDYPRECTLAYTLMKYQFVMCISLIYDFYQLYLLSDYEKQMLDILMHEEKSQFRK